jgi:hypothetical protein
MLFAARTHAQNVSFQTVPQSISVPSAPAATKVAINVISQSVHMLTYSWASLAAGPLCEVYLDGSQTGQAGSWKVLAVGLYETSGVDFNDQTIYVNGYYPFLRLDLNPLNASACVGKNFTANYLGMQGSIALNPQTLNGLIWGAVGNSSANPGSVLIGGSSLFALASPGIIRGISCTNTAASTGFLQLYNTTSIPANGATGFFFQQAIPAAGMFAYHGPPIAVNNQLFATFTTAAGGSTGLAGASCNFQMDYTGPFYPFTANDPN